MICVLYNLCNEFPKVIDNKHKITLVLDRFMDANDFAITFGRHIHINANAYRDINRLDEEYKHN